MTDLEILRGARALITPAGSWTKGVYAFREAGEQTICRCSAGAILHATGANNLFGGVADLRAAGAFALLVKAVEVKDDETDEAKVMKWNDEPIRTHHEVLAAFDRAIVLAGAA